MRKIIVVNATALDRSGALTILKQFIFHAGKDSDNNYIIFTSVNLSLECNKNIKLIPMNKKSWLNRIVWDFYGLSRYLTDNKIKCDIFISLQNTSVNLDKSIPQYVYIHQSIPFSEIKVRCSRFNDAKIFIYKYIYSFFMIAHHRSNSIYIVQTNWMRSALMRKWPKKINKNNIMVIKPDYDFNFDYPCKKYNKRDDDNKRFRLLYPATPLKYKNHLIILKALSIIKKSNDSGMKFTFFVTFKKGECLEFDRLASSLELDGYIEYLGILSRRDLHSYYITADCIVFPSYIETFGLPLAEAASLNKKIVASDLAYARDVLEGYQKVYFAKYDDPNDWKDNLQKVYADRNNKSKCSNESNLFVKRDAPGWPEFFKSFKD